MKKKLGFIFLVLILVIGICFVFYKNNEFNKDDIITKEKGNITLLKEKYNNTDIVGVLEIPNVLKTVVVKHSDNEFYLTHNIKKQKDKLGTVFMDYRINLDSNKVLIYGHNSTRGNDLPFVKLDNYVNKKFYLKHPKIYFYSDDRKYEYDIFSAYVETEDFDYVNLNNYNGLTYLEHINKLKNKSNYDTKVSLNKDSKIIILQTCNVESGYDGSMKNTLVMGVLKERK